MASSQKLLNPTNLSSAILKILPHFLSLRHIAAHALSRLLLWYWCNIIYTSNYYLLNIMSVKEIEPKSAAASWNSTLSCLLSSHLHGQLRMQVASFYEFLKILLAVLVKTLAYTTGTTSKHQRATSPELYPKSIVFLRIVAWHMGVFSHLPNVWGYSAGCCNVIKNAAKKRISTSNFETSSHWNVTAKKTIHNMYFRYVDMAWFHSLSTWEHNMLHLTVWPVHKKCPMSIC